MGFEALNWKRHYSPSSMAPYKCLFL
uniref:Uncharacterized protein n=1 Tax=Rhizophora mucronata TaxID=61149 RepID=A0A2P2N945_RHIMU